MFGFFKYTVSTTRLQIDIKISLFKGSLLTCVNKESNMLRPTCLHSCHMCLLIFDSVSHNFVNITAHVRRLE